MKLGIVLNSNEPETAWNAFRLGVLALKEGNEAKVFLLGNGVECTGIRHETFNVEEKIREFASLNGMILACGTCIKARNQKESALCPISTMKDLLELIQKSDKIISLG
ncbi:DsrE family protein [archaeon]|nr:DsrE family protein [archaeon]